MTLFIPAMEERCIVRSIRPTPLPGACFTKHAVCPTTWRLIAKCSRHAQQRNTQLGGTRDGAAQTSMAPPTRHCCKNPNPGHRSAQTTSVMSDKTRMNLIHEHITTPQITYRIEHPRLRVSVLLRDTNRLILNSIRCRSWRGAERPTTRLGASGSDAQALSRGGRLISRHSRPNRQTALVRY